VKIAIVHWIVNDVGGINSWTENFIIGLRRLGHECQLYYGSHQRQLGCSPDHKVPRSRRWHLLPAKLLSYHPVLLASSIRTLNTYDLIVFAHPSPHPTKGNTEIDSPKGWQAFYRNTKPFKISVFHDRHWDRTNAWIAEVRDCVGYAHAAQHHFVNAVAKFTEDKIPFGWSLFPLLIPETLPPKEKIRRFVLATQWLALKNHRFLIPHLNSLKFPLHSYGSGQTYHKLLPEMKRVYREDHHQDKVAIYNPKSSHIHWGHCEYRQMLNAMKRAWFSLDMSIQGMTNMTHWEPMTVGTLSVMERRVIEDEFCEIPEDCCISFSIDDVVEELNKIGKTSTSILLKIQQKAWKMIQKCNCQTIAKQILTQAGVSKL
jgi:hypothetical protein